MASVKTPKGRFFYKPLMNKLHDPNKCINRQIAYDNLKEIISVLNDLSIKVTPAYGTLLGIIRDNDFIEWDHDIDMFILSEDKQLFLSSLWLFKERGFELVRVDRCGYLYSIMRHGEYVDFYIMERISPEIRTSFGEFFILDRFLTELRDWDFKGMSILVPRDYEECLDFLYGDWRTPVKYDTSSVSYVSASKANIIYWLKGKLPWGLRFYLQKKRHKKDLNKFLAKCRDKGVTLNCPVHY